VGSKPEDTAEEAEQPVSQAFFVVLGEVEAGEFAVILLRSFVISLSSVGFGVETAEPATLAVESDVGGFF